MNVLVPSPPADGIPRRVSLVAQAAETLRAGIAGRRWEGALPGERDLCRALQIGRNTLRGALRELQAAGWIEPGRSGMPRAIARAPRVRRLARRPDRVVFLTGTALPHMQPSTLLQCDLLREHLGAMAMELEVRTSRAFQLEKPDDLLGQLAARERSALWVLHHSPRPVQEWFAARGEPCIVLGYAHEGVSLPCVTENVKAAVQHAVGRLGALGHRRLALLRPRSALAGHVVAERAIEGEAERSARSGLQAFNAYHDGTVRGIVECVDGLFDRQAPPTALLTVTTATLVTLLTHLHRRGIRVPGDVSIVSLFDDPILEHVVPALARYRVNPNVIVKRLYDRILALRDGVGNVRSGYIMPEWVPGNTLARPPLSGAEAARSGA